MMCAAAEKLAGIPDFEVPELSVNTAGIEGVVSDMTAKLEILKSYSDSLSDVKEKFAGMGSALETRNPA